VPLKEQSSGRRSRVIYRPRRLARPASPRSADYYFPRAWAPISPVQAEEEGRGTEERERATSLLRRLPDEFASARDNGLRNRHRKRPSE